MIESVELVVAALAAGAAAGAGETASTAVKDAYTGVKSLAVRVLRRAKAVPSEVVELVEADEVAPAGDEASTVGRRELTAALTAAGAGNDQELVAAALKVLELTDPDGTHAGKYRILLHGNKGVQVGDHNTQHNTFH
ncbi:hypothetical protein DMC61_14720 [Amycolatopsis sp. WAC 04169]|uniref:hypothetical protein n=1 Tax=Amycolatopsis sp. WAC 04169 TaxID=2203197 RepID=UPI000F788ADC|nr:hypothetical protein [Amycolatopsis sp. WAC 04169]RSN31397.1 hypothetical protein DMC61_14720 [Amycolatopsis sp. WAC 04169]